MRESNGVRSDGITLSSSITCWDLSSCLQQSSCMTVVKMSIKNWNNLKNMEIRSSEQRVSPTVKIYSLACVTSLLFLLPCQGWFYLCDCALKEFFADSLENICEAKCRSVVAGHFFS